jgi:16S rRNA (guanine527-N7)-methyltransferase
MSVDWRARRSVPDSGLGDFAKAHDVSRETLALLETYVALLADWNQRHNLVSAKSLENVWHRHVWDSAQLIRFVPNTATSLIDLGSGAGFPGIVLATMLRERPGFRAVLYESIAKKCRFLEEATARLNLNIEVRNARMEEAKREQFDLVTARACAPLAKLLGYARPFQAANTVNLFLKGQSVESELTEARTSWRMTLERHVSLTDPSGVILEIRDLSHVTNSQRRNASR